MKPYLGLFVGWGGIDRGILEAYEPMRSGAHGEVPWMLAFPQEVPRGPRRLLAALPCGGALVGEGLLWLCKVLGLALGSYTPGSGQTSELQGWTADHPTPTPPLPYQGPNKVLKLDLIWGRHVWGYG